MKSFLTLIFLLCAASGTAAKPLAPGDVPEPLKSWIGWALHGHEERACPFVYANSEAWRCAWPTRLELNLGDRQGSFRMQWDVQAESRVSLPGHDRAWPQDVQVDGAAALVTADEDRPVLSLPAGSHVVTGKFLWDRLPESLPVPRDSGLILLTVNGRAVGSPAFNEQGQIWIEGGGRGESAAAVTNRLEIQVFRKVDDDVPLQMTTRLRLDVAGQQRELLLSGGLPPEFIPMALQSPLPARLEPDGRLRIQIRPGHWEVDIIARQPGEISKLSLPAAPAEPWPAEEIWVYASHPALRLVDVQGVPAVDSQQTNLPDEWKPLPAYRVLAGETLELRSIRRGDPDPEPDALNLRRDIWLDFDGGGYTVQDRIAGRMTRDWRIGSASSLAPGRILVNGQPQPITKLDANGNAGVELRRGRMDLAADSRIEGGGSQIPASGWDKDFRSVAATLHLPPGWRLLAATGVDEAPGTWIGRWTLLDLFVVLITTVLIARLLDWRAGLVAFAGLVLLWQEGDAPRYVWLNLILAIAVLRQLPAGRLATAVRWYRNVAVAGLLLVVLPFIADQVRLGLYPQLANPGFMPSADGRNLYPATAELAPQSEENLAGAGAIPEAEAPMSPADAIPPPPAAAPSAPEPLARRSAPKPELKMSSSVSTNRSQEIDPNAVTQTGPGLPHWRWLSVQLRWNGPVLAGQEVRLYLQSPAMTLLFNLIRMALAIGLVYLLLRPRDSRPGTPDSPRQSAPGSGPAAAMGLALAISIFFPAIPAKADLPSPEMLDTLTKRLLEPPGCLPRCAEIPSLSLKAEGMELREQLEIHADRPVAIPLPAREGQWLPARVELDGAPAAGLARNPDGTLWLAVKAGRHSVVLSGPLPAREQIQIPLPLRPRRVVWQASGWTLDGIQENGVPDGQLQLARVITSGAAHSPALEAKPLPPFLEITRTLHFGLDWRVSTQVKRLSPADGPAVAEIPLLDGESVTTQGLPAKNGKLLVNLVAGQESLEWDSILAKRDGIRLEAPQTSAWTEVWRVDISPIWHLSSAGIAVAHHQDAAGNWLPEWHPWPGESVDLKLTRPAGVPGATLTIDQSTLQVSPGERATDSRLDLVLRSSQGGQHPLRLPEGAILQGVTIDGRTQPIRQQDGILPIPVHPGTQNIGLTWRQDSGIGGRFRTPAVDLGAPSVNASVSIRLGLDRWVLLTGGPKLGPAVLFWGVLAVTLLVGAGLGRLPLTPLKAWQWMLLLVGLSQIETAAAMVVAGWLLALGWRRMRGAELGDLGFNTLQVGLALLTPLALALLFYAVQQGLLGLPEMQVAGNQSSAAQLNWYQDRSPPGLPQPWVISAPLWAYRLLMLLWALWLAFALVEWLRWGWRCWSSGGFWRPRKPKAPAVSPTNPA